MEFPLEKREAITLYTRKLEILESMKLYTVCAKENQVVALVN